MLSSHHQVVESLELVLADHEPGVLPAPHYELTIDRLMVEDALRGSRLVSGYSNRSRAIAWCCPYPPVDPAESLKEAALYVAANSVDSPDELDRVLATAIDGNVALLVLSTDEDPPDPFTAAAERSGLPVVIAPSRLTFRSLDRLVAEKTLAQTAHVLEYGVRVHRALVEVLYRGAGLNSMALQMSRLSQCPVFILDAALSPLAYEYVGTDAVPDPAELVRLLSEQLGRTSAEAPEGTSLLVVRLEDRIVECVVAPIILGGSLYGWIVIAEGANPPTDHELRRHLVIAEQASTVTGSELLRLRSVDEAQERARGDFVHALLYGRFSDAHELAARARHHDFDADARYVVLVADIAIEPSTVSGQERRAAVVRALAGVDPRPGPNVLVTDVGSVFVVVCPVDVKNVRPDSMQEQARLSAYAHAIQKQLSARLRGDCWVSYGRPAVGASGIRASYREARITHGIAQRLLHERVNDYANLRVFAVISELASTEEGQSFASEVLQPLNTDTDNGGDLHAVALAYIRAGGNLNAAARELSVHRNTMLYKLDKISRLLRMDLRAADSQFTLWLAHRISMLREVDDEIRREAMLR